MPIKIPNDLPARAVLEREGIPVIDESDALKQDIRPLQVALLNLMPDKISTENQILRALGHSPLQIEMTLLRTATYEARNTSKEHLLAFYQTWGQVKGNYFDTLIVTGAPVEHLGFYDVAYWREFISILDWAKTHVHSSFFICWAAQAALYHFHRIRKFDVGVKLFGVFPHKVLKPYDPLTAGFDACFYAPVSRYSGVRRTDVASTPGIDILAESDETGICLLHEPAKRRAYMFNHLEYDANTLAIEYQRDCADKRSSPFPKNYFPDDNPTAIPRMTWRAHRSLLFSNWINLVYRQSPYDLAAWSSALFSGPRKG